MKQTTLNFILLLVAFSIHTLSVAQNENVKRTYFKDSIISSEKWYNQEKKADSFKTYFKSGEPRELFYYKNGRFNGKAFQFNKKGEVVTTWTFNNGKFIDRKDHIIEFNKKNEAKIKKAHQDLIEVNKKLVAKPGDFRALFTRAHIRHLLGNYTMALGDVNHVLHRMRKVKETKNTPAPRNYLSSMLDLKASIYESLEMENRATHYKYKAVEVDPENNRLVYNLGAYLYTIKSYKLALVYLHKALEKWPNHSFTHRLLAALYSDFEDYDKALYHINIAFEKEDDLLKHSSGRLEHDIRTIRGYIHHKLGQSEKGIADLEEALRLNNENSFAYRHLGVIYHDLGNHQKACELLQKAEKLGYEKTHDRYDLKTYLNQSCNSSISSKKPTPKKNNKPFVYPNPTRNSITIKHLSHKKTAYSLFNFDSKLIRTGTLLQNESIDLSGLPSGLYILNTSSEGLYNTFKIIKE